MLDNKRLIQIIRDYGNIDRKVSIEKINASNNVYKISLNSTKAFIVKEYSEKNHFHKEKIGLKLLEKHNIKAARLIDHSAEDSVEMWILYRYIEGNRLADLDISKVHERNKLFFQIGVEVSKIHELIRLIMYNYYNNEELDLFKQDSKKKFKDAVKYYYTSLCGKYPVYAKLFEMAYDFINENIESYYSKKNFALVVGDLNSKNIVVNKNTTELEGLIDFEYMSYENIYCDFVTLIKYFREDFQNMKSFIRGYSSVNRKFKYCDNSMKVLLIHNLLRDCNIPYSEYSHISITEKVKSILS